MAQNVSLVDTAPQSTAVIAVVTTWEVFPSLWGPLLAEVWQAIRATNAPPGATSCSTKTTRRPSRSASSCSAPSSHAAA